MNHQPPPPKPFTWSWSRLKNFRSCARKHMEVDLKKTYPEPPSPALKWGDEFHKRMADRLSLKRLMPIEYAPYEYLAEKVEATCRELGVTPRVELKLACDAQLGQCGYFDRTVWVRANVDVLIVKPPVVMAIDWKTGKIKPESQQLALTALMVMSHYPDVDHVITKYVWVGSGDPAPETVEHYTRGRSHYGDVLGKKVAMQSIESLWMEVEQDLQAMQRAWDSGVYLPTPSGLCVKHCPVTTCEYHGRGSR